MSAMRRGVLIRMAVPGLLVGALVSSAATSGKAGGLDLGDLGTYPMWSRVEIVLPGPASEGMATPNPFLVAVDVRFTGPGAQVFVVPSFYDGDGSGGMDGNVWKVRFSPNAAGDWSFVSSSADTALNGHTGTFHVTEPSGCSPTTPDGLPNFACVGRLEYTGEHYLSFADGGHWLKGGVDEPEDILAAGDTTGFPTRELAVDYLASRGVNSLYVMLDNIGGDSHNVWPWVGSTENQAQANHERFDLVRLAEWEAFFTYAQEHGLVLHIVWEDDSAWTGFNRAAYYREMVARFGHHNGLIWNLTEEFNETYSVDAVKGFAQMLTDLDAYGHPLTVHHSRGVNVWEPFLGDSRFDLTSFQTRDLPQNKVAVEWFTKVEASGRVIPVSFDEGTRTLTPADRALFRHIVWAGYMGGANTEIFTHITTDWRLQDYDAQLSDMTRARRFVESVGYWQMRPRNDLLLSGVGYMFAEDGVAYLAYLPSGGSIEVDLRGASGVLTGDWYDPRSGSSIPAGPIAAGGTAVLTAPDGTDWALRLLSDSAPGATATPTGPTPSETPSAGTPTETPTSLIPSNTPRARSSATATALESPTPGSATPGASPSPTKTPRVRASSGGVKWATKSVGFGL